MAFLFAANTSPALGRSDGSVQLLEEPALPAKVLIKSDVLCCWEEVWQQDVTAHEPRSEVPAGKPLSNGDVKEQAEDRVFCFLSALIFCLRFISSCGTENSL